MSSNILIVGGGAAGLTTAGALKHLGIESTILDQDEHTGDVWARRYDRLHLHTVRPFSGLAHLPIPRGYPKYLARDEFVQYLQAYAQFFELNIVHNSIVTKVRKDGEAWLAETSLGQHRARMVVMATGHYNRPFIPDWPGLSNYLGQFLHSIKYKSGKEFAGKRVLVIGSGNSGSEIAIDLVEQGAAFIANSIRTPPPVVRRDILGTPVQVFGILLSSLPPRLADKIGSTVSRIANGDLTRYGIRPAAWGPFTAYKVPIIDVGWLPAVKKGMIKLRGDITRFTHSGVVYSDGKPEDFDVVISATGFVSGLDQLIDIEGLLNVEGSPKFQSGAPTSQPGFYFMGYTESSRGHLFEAKRDSQRLAKLIKQELLPEGA